MLDSFQVIIGNEVPQFYNDFSAICGFEKGFKEEGKQLPSNLSPVQRICFCFS